MIRISGRNVNRITHAAEFVPFPVEMIADELGEHVDRQHNDLQIPASRDTMMPIV